MGRSKIKGSLDENSKHYKEFVDVGYDKSDTELLVQHIHDGYDLLKMNERPSNGHCYKQFNIYMDLGKNKKRNFVTAWSIDKEGDNPRFVTAYRKSQKKKED